MSKRAKSQPRILRDLLEIHTVPILRQLAKLLASGLPTRKAELVALIQGHLENPDRLRKIWGELDALQQAAVSEMVHSFSSFDAQAFRAKYGGDPEWGRPRKYAIPSEVSLLDLFIYRGVMPRDLQKRLKAFVPPPRTVQIDVAEELPASVPQTWYEYDHRIGRRKKRTKQIPLIRCETEQLAQHDIHAVLRLVDAGKVRASEKTKRVTAAGAKAITQVLQGGDFYPPDAEPNYRVTDPGPIKAFAWPLILQSAGLARLSGNRLQLTPAGKTALRSSPHQAIGRAWKRWQKTRLLDEFNRVHTIKGQSGIRRRSLTAVVGRRATVVDALATCPAHEWIAFDEFSRFMRASGHTFQVARDPWLLYISHPDYGSLGYEGYGGWNILQGRYMMAFLFEYAATMGLIDVVYIHPSGARRDYSGQWGTDDLDCLSRYDGLLYFRINGLGAWCLDLSEKYVPTPPKVRQILSVLPNMDVVATAPLPPGDVLILEQFAEQSSDVVWRIQPATLLKTVEEGHAVPDMVTFLETKAGGSLPDTVATFFNEMADRVSRMVHRGPAVLIEAQDAALAQLVVNDSRLRSLCMLAGERHIVVPADAESAFRRALRDLGYALPPS